MKDLNNRSKINKGIKHGNKIGKIINKGMGKGTEREDGRLGALHYTMAC